MAAEQPLCAAATTCARAGRCSSALDPAEWTQLVAIVLVPIAYVILLPALSELWFRPLVAGLDPAELLLATPGCVHCTVSGIVVAIAGFIVVFCAVFFLLLSSEYPCATALGECGSISCACGNVMPKGYVFMCVMLVLVSTHLVRDFASLPPSHHRKKWVLISCSLGLSLTGIFPESFSADTLAPSALLRASYILHSTGLVAAAMIVIIPFCWMLRHALRFRAIRVQLVGTRVLTFLTLLSFSCAYLTCHERPDVFDQCTDISDAKDCNSWGHVSTLSCVALEHSRDRRVHEYTCGWINRTLSADERLLLPATFLSPHAGECVRRRCPLFRYARSTALEFACLLLTAFYTGFFAVPDAKGLTHFEVLRKIGNDALLADRPPPLQIAFEQQSH